MLDDCSTLLDDDCAGLMDAHVERIHQYAAQEQADLRVRIKVPGSWKGFNNLTPAERRAEYSAEATDWVPSFKFPKTANTAAFASAAIKFICPDDVTEDPNHAGFVMPIADWNRYRHHTYKADRDAEKLYIRAPFADPVAPIADAPAEAERPLIYGEFELLKSALHSVRHRDRGVKSATAEY